MSGVDFEELFKSPLDDLPQPENSWSYLAGGLVAGALLAVILTFAFGGYEAAPAVTTVTGATSTMTEPPPPAEPAPFPPGHVEIAPGIGAAPVEVVLGDETIVVSFATSVARGGDPQAEIWPIGGAWTLEDDAGGAVGSTRMILGRFSPGVFSVEFPAAPFTDRSAFTRATMVERWDRSPVVGSVTLDFSGEPYVAPDPVIIPVSSEVTLLIPVLELGRFLGRAEWVLQGVGSSGARVLLTCNLLDEDGNPIGSYRSFPEILAPAKSGVTEVTWDQPFPTSPEGATTLVIDYSVGVAEPVTTDIVFDLSATPIGR